MTAEARVARAICEAISGPWHMLSKPGKAALMREAAAAIEALRKPEPEDAEVWGCPVCGQIVDRKTMTNAAVESDHD